MDGPADRLRDVLSERDVAADPVTEFHRWYDAARTVHGDGADAMVVATADAAGVPSARVVLLRGVDARGFCFFTNFGSRKGRELAANPRAAIVWHWTGLGRQVRATGAVARVDDEESDAYWRSRPEASRLSAWASHQSETVPDRAALEDAVAAVGDRFAGGEVTRPPFWGGYRLVPEEVEFWLHRDDRLHDRLRYRRDGAAWTVERLQP